MNNRKKLILVLLLVAWGAANLWAQTDPAEPQQEPPADTATANGTEEEEQDGSSPVTPLVEGLFSVRNRVGFALSTSQYYTPAANAANVARQSGAFTSANASMYSNFRRFASDFHIDYSYGYRRDNRGLHLTRATHTGSFRWNWTHTLGRRWTIGVRDTALAAVYDYDTTFSPFAYQAQQPYLLTTDIFVVHQKVTRNVFTVDTNYQIGRSTNVGLFASDEYARYQSPSTNRAHVVQAGINASHQLTKFLFIGSSYTTLINPLTKDSQESSIHRLRLITFNLRRRGFDFFSSGGLQYARNPGSQFAADAEAGMTAGSKATMFNLRYNHGFLSVLGVGAAVETDTVHTSFTQKFGSRLSVGLNSDYMRFSNGGSTQSAFQTLSSGVGVQLGLVQGLVFSVNHNYISQLARNVGFQAPRLNRQASSATLHYVLPPLRLRGR
jgi:hypothetical protein